MKAIEIGLSFKQDYNQLIWSFKLKVLAKLLIMYMINNNLTFAQGL